MPAASAPVCCRLTPNHVVQGDVAVAFDALVQRAESAAERCLLPILAMAVVHWLTEWAVPEVVVTAQPEIPGIGRIDYLVELFAEPGQAIRFVLEVDGLAYHQNQQAFANDRRRDRATVALGMLPVRFTMAELQELGWWATTELTNIGVEQLKRVRAVAAAPRQLPAGSAPGEEDEDMPF
jgi:hypothetical protein